MFNIEIGDSVGSEQTIQIRPAQIVNQCIPDFFFDLSGRQIDKVGGHSGDTVIAAMDQIAEAAVLQNVAFQRGFLDDQWGYVGIVCKMGDAEDSCWGFETYKDYHLEAARDMAAQLELSVSREQAEAQYWADRDVVTTA